MRQKQPHFNEMTATHWMFASAGFITLNSLFSKVLSPHFGVLLFTLLRFLVPAVIAWGVFYQLKLKLPHRKDAPLLMLRSIILILSQLCFIIYLTHSNIMNATLLYLTAVLWTPLLNTFFNKTLLNIKNVIYLIIGFIGVCLLLYTHTSSQNPRIYIIVGVLSGFFNACNQVVNYRISQSISPQHAMLGTLTICSVLMMLIILAFSFFHPSTPVLHINGYDLIFIGLLSASVIMNQLSRSLAYRRTQNPATVLPLVYLSVPLCAVLNHVIFATTTPPLAWIGTIFILSSCLLTIRH